VNIVVTWFDNGSTSPGKEVKEIQFRDSGSRRNDKFGIDEVPVLNNTGCLRRDSLFGLVGIDPF